MPVLSHSPTPPDRRTSRRWPPRGARIACGWETFTVGNATVTVLSLAGEIDLTTEVIVHAALSHTLDRSTSDIVVDLSDVPFCSTSGYGALVDTADAAATTGRHFAVVTASPQLGRVCALLWPDRHIPRHDTAAAAISEIRARHSEARRVGPAPTPELGRVGVSV